MKVAIYARVSTSNNGQDPTMQTREIREYAERRGWTVAGEYVDIGISGTKEKRPELDRLMADAHRRRMDVVAVWKFDRMARSVSHLLRALETFNSLGIVPRPSLGLLDKLFWVIARSVWSAWKDSLILVTPETVVRWHRTGFRMYWRLISRVRKQVGRRPTPKEVRELISRIVAENPCRVCSLPS